MLFSVVSHCLLLQAEISLQAWEQFGIVNSERDKWGVRISGEGGHEVENCRKEAMRFLAKNAGPIPYIPLFLGFRFQ